MTERVLLVDDEPRVLEALQRQLRKKFDISIANSGKEALKLIEHSPPYAVIVSDMRMPEMNGSEFFAQARQLTADSVRIILSGQAEMESTIAAVNRGGIFRFLTKPCDTEEIHAALDSGIRQYRLVLAERELLEKTLHGTVQILNDILSLTNPVAQSRANRIARLASGLAHALGLKERWELQLSFMLSQIGCITLPDDVFARIGAGQEITDEARSIYLSHPQVAGKLIREIPRLEPVAEIVGRQFNEIDFHGLPEDPAQWELTLAGSFVLKAATELDDLLSSGCAPESAVRKMKRLYKEFPCGVINAFESMDLELAPIQRISIKMSQLRVGMILDEELISSKGLRLVPMGQEVTHSLLVRLQSIADGVGIVEPFRVQVPG